MRASDRAEAGAEGTPGTPDGRAGKPRPPAPGGWRRAVVWSLRVLALAAVVAAAVTFLVARSRGYRLALVRTAAEPSAVVAVDFAPAVPPPRLSNDFAAAERPRNVVLILGDGMGFNQIAAARMALAGANGRLFIERFPVTGWISVHNLDSLEVDSAASASALATGFKATHRTLSQARDGSPYRTVLEAGLARGMRAGLITTSYVLDATPAAFVAHVASRRELPEVARQMAASGVEFLAGEGVATDSPGAEARVAALLEPFAQQGYELVTSWEALARDGRDPARKVLALLPPGTLATTGRTVPLAAVAGLALDRLAGSDGGFFLLVEDEDADTGGHRGDLPRVLAAIEALDGVARRAVEAARSDRRTLVVVTSDHETGALVLATAAPGEPLPYRWVSSGHTSGPVPLFAYGPGAERFSGVLDNTDVPRILAELLGLDLS